MKEVKGNIFNFITEGVYLVQQTNTEGVMGAGIAAQIRQIFPNVYNKYRALCASNINIMGACQIVDDTYKGYNVKICNCFAQDLSTYYNGHLTDYNALYNSLYYLSNVCEKDATILIPKNIGCGIGGGDWNVVLEIITKVLGNFNIIIVDFNGDSLI